MKLALCYVSEMNTLLIATFQKVVVDTLLYLGRFRFDNQNFQKKYHSKSAGMSFPFNSRRSAVYSRHGQVACTQPLAAEIGLSILKAGGNAVDAAVAVAAAMNGAALAFETPLPYTYVKAMALCVSVFL